MTAKQAREWVLARLPQARYINLSAENPCHCIDDDYNDRYLAYNQRSREAAWIKAANTLVGIKKTGASQ